MGRPHLETTSGMITHCEIVKRDGIPEDTLMVQVPPTSLWLECKLLKNGKWNARLKDPMGTWTKEVWRSISGSDLEHAIQGLYAGSFQWLKDARPKAIRKLLHSFVPKYV